MAENEAQATEGTVEVDLKGLSNDELVEFEALLVADYEDKRNAAEGSFSAEATAELDGILAAVEAARAEMQVRVVQAEKDAKATKVSGADFLAKLKANKPEAKVEEPVVEAKVEPVVEAVVTEPVVEAKVEAPAVVISPKGLESDAAPASVTASSPVTIVASADVPNFAPGQELDGLKDIARAFIAKRPTIRGTDPGADGTRFLVASIRSEYPEDRKIDMDTDATMAKIAAVTSLEAITASGGLCAPLTPLYEQRIFGDAARPVRDALPAFNASRGGIRFVPPPRLADLAGSVRRTTATQDAAGYTNQTPAGSTAPKPCLHVTCEAEQTCIIEAVSKCLTFGNFGARTFPEQVQAWLSLGMIEFARYAEIELLDGIQAGSTRLNAGQIYGATGSFLETISALVTSFRSRYRISDNVRLRALLPFWVRELVKVDLAAQAPGDGLGRYNVSDAEISNWFSTRGINASYYQDYTTTAGAPFAEPVANSGVPSWPNQVEWFIFPEGAWLYLDGGVLDLGLVRDSTLNSQNDYQVFYEEFFGVCNVGIESLRIISDLCPNGTYAPAAEALRACASPFS